MKSLYVYTVRKNGTVRRRWGNALLENKRALLEARKAICKSLRERGYEQVSYLWYAGSSVFSIFEIMLNTDFSNWKDIKKYIRDPIVEKSIRSVPVSVKKPAYFVLILLLKMRMLGTLRLCFEICRN